MTIRSNIEGTRWYPITKTTEINMVFTVPESREEFVLGVTKTYTYVTNWKTCHEHGGELRQGATHYTDDLILSTVLSFLAPITTNCITGARTATPAPNRLERTQEEQDQSVLATALASLMTLAKPVTQLNTAAYQKRWSAALASQSVVDMISAGTWVGIIRAATIFQRIVSTREDLRSEIVDRLLTLTNETGVKGAIISQIRMVWSYASLKAAEYMILFINAHCRALEIPSVLDQALLLRQRWDTALQNDINFEYCRVRDPNAHPELNHSHFPDLYYASISYAKANKMIDDNFHVSQSAKVQHALLIDKYIKKTAAAIIGEMSEETKQKLMRLGYPVTRRRAYDSDTDEEEEEENLDNDNQQDDDDDNDDILAPHEFPEPRENDLYQLPNHERCATHTLHLISARDIDKARHKNNSYRKLHDAAMAKCQAVWNICSRSPKASEIYLEVTGNSPTSPCPTRWNSYYNCITDIYYKSKKP